MTEKPTVPVSMSKTGSAPSAPGAKAPRPNPPQLVKLAAGALVLTGIFSLAAAFSLYGLKGWYFRKLTDSNPKPGKKGYQTVAQLHDQVDKSIRSLVISGVVLLIALIIVAFSAYRGRYWSRWAVLGLWVLSTFIGTLGGIGSVFAIGSSEPIAFKLLSFGAGIFFVAAVVLSSMKPSVAYFNLSKPVRPGMAEGVAPRRGFFAPRPPAAPRGAAARGAARGSTARGSAARGSARGAAAAKAEATTRPASSAPDRSRSKQRASSEAVAKGAELARTRAKASKSRRTDV